jgi:dynein assembly factor 3
MDGLGNINWWGFSPALDLQSVLNNSHENAELNFLLVGCGDPRHLLRTFASKGKWPKRKLIRFYVYEPRLELYARDLLLLSLAIEHPARRGIQEKTELFMEIFGNIQVRQQTADYIRTTSNELIKCITDFDYMRAKNLGCFDLSLLKFKERDFLESIFKYWRADTKKFDYFPAKKCWDLRLRTYLQTRYDTRSNSFDWDYSMKFADRKNTHVINSRIYASWRETGKS